MKLYIGTLLVGCFIFYSCNLFRDHPDTCNENPGMEKLLIFVGEKVEVEEMKPDQSSDPFALPYSKFKARYKVLDVVCGNYRKKEISFIAYDHYGRPGFAKYDHVILYVYNHKDTFYHENYLYDDLYKTKDGEWASPYSFLNFVGIDSSVQKMQPKKIEFVEEVSYDVKGGSRNWLKEHYPSPFYTIKNKRAIAAYGNYVDEVVEFRKRGILKDREYYGNPDTNKLKIKVADVALADIKSEEEIQVNEPEVVKAAYIFFDLLKKRDTATVRKMSFDSVVCSVCEEPPRFDYENNLETLDSFFISAKKYLYFSQLWLEIQNKVYTVSGRTLHPEDQHRLGVKTDSPVVYKVTFTIIENIEGRKIQQDNNFEFVKTNGNYKFYGMKTEFGSFRRERGY